MSDLLESLWDAIERDDFEGVAAMLRPLDEKSRKTLWEDLDPYGRTGRRRFQRTQAHRDNIAEGVAVAWTAPSAAVFAQRSSGICPWDSPREAPIADALIERSPTWLSRLSLLGEWGSWRLHREFYRRGAIARGDDAEYLSGMVLRLGLNGRSYSVRQGLLDDPSLLDHEVYELFQHEEVGGALGHEVGHERYRDKNPDAFRGPYRPQEHGWSWVLAGFASEGRLDRERLIDGAFAALLRDTTWPNRTWFATFLDRLDLTLDEMAHHHARYLRLLSAGVSPAVAYGQRGVRSLLDVGRIDPDDFLRESAAPFVRKEKTTAVEQLKLLTPFLRDPRTRELAASAVAEALAHPRPDVQMKAWSLLEPIFPTLSDGARATVVAVLESAAPTVRSKAAEVVGQTPDEAHAAPTTSWDPPPPRSGPPDLTDDADFERAALQVMGRGDVPPMTFEAVLDGLLRRAGMTPAQVTERFPAALTQARKAARAYHPVRRDIGLLLLTLGRVDGEEDALQSTTHRTTSLLVLGRTREAQRRLIEGQASLLLSLPVDGAGRVSPSVLDDRLACLGKASEIATVDKTVAELRAGRYEPNSGHVGGNGWDRAGRYATYRADAGFFLYGGNGPFDPAVPLDLWWTLFPHDSDRAIAKVFGSLVRDLDHEPSTFEPALLGPLCEWLVDLDEPLSPVATAAVTLGLSAKVTMNRLAAVDALLALSHRRRIDVNLAIKVSAAQVEAGVAKVNRLAGSCAEVAHVQPHLAITFMVGVAEHIAEHRDVGKLLEPAVELATADGPPPIGEAIRKLASKKGSSVAVRAARALVELTGHS